MHLTKRTAAVRARAYIVIVGVILVAGGGRVATRAGQAGAPLSFEVASVRPNNEGGFNFVGVQIGPGGSISAVNVDLRRLIAFAYGLDVYQAVQGSADVLDRNFDVLAKAGVDVKAAPFPEIGPLNIMMQTLLTDRFELVVRWEDRRQEGYALVRSGDDRRLGPGIRPSELECPRPVTTPKVVGDTRSCLMRIINNELTVTGRRMSDLARFLSTSLRRPVVDRTEIVGRYDVRMTFDAFELAEIQGLRPIVPDEARSNLPSLFTALDEQLGLKLEPQRLNVPTLIVERVEPPTEN